MDFKNQLLFFFSALGAFNGLILAFYFLFYLKPKRLSNYFLGGMLLALSVRIWKSVFFYFYSELSLHFLQVGLTACYFIGPFLYLYTKTALREIELAKNVWKLHLFILILLAVFVSVKYPYYQFPEIWRGPIFKIIYYQWLIYIIFSAASLRNIFLKKEKYTNQEIWILSIFGGNFIIWLAYYTSAYTSYIVGALSFSFVFYLIFLLFIFKKNKGVQQPKYGDKKINKSEAESLIAELQQLMKNEHLYVNSDLTLPIVAKKMSISTHQLSQLINTYYEKRFSDFVNEYRIEDAKKLIIENTSLKIEAIAEKVGFNSTTTFYTAFKKVTGTTPAKFKSTKL